MEVGTAVAVGSTGDRRSGWLRGDSWRLALALAFESGLALG